MNFYSILLTVGIVVLAFALFGKLLGMTLKVIAVLFVLAAALLVGWYFLRPETLPI